jgi:5-methylcytosine-specific restriction protein A
MALKAYRTCGKVGCPTLIKDGSHCPKHLEQHNQRVNAERNNDELRGLYKTARWLRFRTWFLRNNPLCQRIWDGEQCHHIATEVHHRRGLREHPEDLCDPEHCVALCRACHHKFSGDKGEEQYLATDCG